MESKLEKTLLGYSIQPILILTNNCFFILVIFFAFALLPSWKLNKLEYSLQAILFISVAGPVLGSGRNRCCW